MIRIACLLVLLTATALAAPPARVLVADPDPELVRAIKKALAPWKIAVVVDSAPTEALALARGTAVDAQFVVWRADSQLVVFDRTEGTSERRGSRAGALDPVSAAAAALTVKTMLRLPPLAQESAAARTPAAKLTTESSPTTGDAGTELRLQVGVGGRLASGSQSEVGGRAMLAVLVRPMPARGLRIGIAGDLGTSTSVDREGFEGTWSNWAALAIVSWSWPVRGFELSPALGVGISRSHLESIKGSMAREESDTMSLFRAGVAVRWPIGRWSLGVSLDADLVPGAPTYTKDQGMSGKPVFEVPGFAGTLGIFAAADLGR